VCVCVCVCVCAVMHKAIGSAALRALNCALLTSDR